MDELDKQLQHLSVINSKLSYSVCGKESPADGNNIQCVAKLVNDIEEHNFSKEYRAALKDRVNFSHDVNSTKKIGPSVPPKPQKKSPNAPEIPQSRLVKQACEPLYAQRLQSLESNTYEEDLKKLPLLSRKQNTYAGIDTETNPLGSKARRKVTLDNPAILEQQLEALEYHKKQLEKRGKLNHNCINNDKDLAPKLSSSSLLADLYFIKPKFLETSNDTRGNALHTSNTSTVSANANSSMYDNITSITTTSLNGIYSNVDYDKNKPESSYADENEISTQQTPLSKNEAALLTSGNNCIYFNPNGSLMPEEETPSPPSPVSSSYSELQRATDVFKTNETSQKGATIAANDLLNVTKPIVCYEAPHGHKLAAPSTVRQLYINKMTYTASDVFHNYNTDIQAKINPHISDYYGYGGFSQASSTYESIYEPINPRPPSQLSTRPHNIMYPSNSIISTMPECTEFLPKSNISNLSALNGLSGSSGVDTNSPVYPINSRRSESKGTLNIYPQNSDKLEAESLTNFLVKSIDRQQELENYGICFKCNDVVIGENSGCTAMDQIYHISCFTCSQCQINLQGKPFYALDCKPYCEFDYLQTLEKCSVCVKPILERILRATGKPYHPQCFICVVCRKSLDGIPFTVDATNQNYCIEDFHKKFAPRCCVCKDPIMPQPGEEETVRVVALDRSFHFECYKCEDCGLLLSSEAEGRGCYPLDDHVLCKSCNARRVQMLTKTI